jgi:membrane protein YdbS with pleckstrin-like domain
MAEPDERVCVEARRHSIVLAGPFALALVLTAAAGACFVFGWPLVFGGAALLVLAALVALRAVWRWERTHVVVTTEKVFVVEGTLRRRTKSVRLQTVAVGLEQTLTGRLFGYGTLVAGPLEVEFVPEVRRVYSLVERLAA